MSKVFLIIFMNAFTFNLFAQLVPDSISLSEKIQSRKRSRDDNDEHSTAPDVKKAKKDTFIYDNYTAKRGEPKMLKIFCSECKAFVMDYQKDGPGRLLRCYLDRIHEPKELRDRQYEKFDTKKSAHLKCHSCRRKIGIPMIYKLENRPAYQMLSDAFYFETAYRN